MDHGTVIVITAAVVYGIIIVERYHLKMFLESVSRFYEMWPGDICGTYRDAGRVDI